MLLSTGLLIVVVALGVIAWRVSALATIVAVAAGLLLPSFLNGDTGQFRWAVVAVVLLLFPIAWYAKLAWTRIFAPADDVFESRDANKHQSTLAIDGHFERGTQGLLAAGATAHNDVVEVRVDGPTSTLTFWRPFSYSGWRVILAGIVSRQAEVEVEPHPIMVASTTLANGEFVITTNLQGLDALPSDDIEHRVNLASVVHVADLLRIHAARITRLGAPVTPRDVPDDWGQAIRANRLDEFERQVNRGLLRRDGESRYRLTIAGLLRFVFRTSPMLKPIHNWLARRDEDQVFAELVIDRSSLGTSKERQGTTERRGLRWWAPSALSLSVVLLMTCFPDVLMGPGGGSRAYAESSIRIPSDLAIPDSFAGAVAVLERVTGKRAEPLLVHPDVDQTPTGIQVVMLSANDAKAVVEQAYGVFLAKGFLLFETNHFGDQYRIGTDAVALAPTRDPFAVMRQIGTNGDNFGIGTDSVISWFRATEREFPLQYTGIGFDFVRASWNTELADATRFGARFLSLCPEVAELGTVSARYAGRELNKDKWLYCWWD